ncbi:major facilitator superfamily domain-containing protein [Mycena leptocephala]|nr:major facilitator superfamily domain-containing protein [Mycena leptocephala]
MTIPTEEKPVKQKKGLFRPHSLRVGNRITNASQLALHQTLWPLFLVTILYFLRGFAYGLLNTLNNRFQNTLGITRTRASGLQAAYFGAYPLASVGYGNWVLRNYGYRAVFMLGLTLEGIGALLMWPAALKRSFGGLCGATFIIGSGLGCLETAANPYMAVTGPPKYAELRCNLALAVQAIGTVVGPVPGSFLFFKDTGDSVDSLETVQWVYLAISIFVFLLAIVFFFSVIPEVTDTDMAQQAELTHVGEQQGEKPFWVQWKLFYAAFAQFCYTGAQVAIATYFINYVTETRVNTSSALGANFLAAAQGCLAVGRFSGSAIMSSIRPRKVFLLYTSGNEGGFFLMASPWWSSSAPRPSQRGNAGLAMLMLTLFFESVCFPTIVALGIRGIGRHTKRGAGCIVGGVVGGAIVPPLMAKVADTHNSTALAMVVPVSFHVGAWSYAACCNFVPIFRDVMDCVGGSDVGLDSSPVGEVEDKQKDPSLENV